MARIDSGIGESCFLKTPYSQPQPQSVQRSHTAPPHHSRPKHVTDVSSHDSRPTDTMPQRPVSEKRAVVRPRLGDTRQKSITSSSENSAKSRSHRNGSKPSSRRTSCTLVDPSRPARHYRVKSSQTVPTLNRDIDDVLALHFRSCSLFQNPAYHAARLHSSPPGNGVVDADFGSIRAKTDRVPTPQTGPDRVDVNATSSKPERSIEIRPTLQRAETTMQWISPCTRKKEYEKIDRANSGLRGMMRRMVPRCVSGPPSPRFYEKDTSDCGSVRRYRVDLSDDEDDEKDKDADEKSTPLVGHQTRKLERKEPKEEDSKTKRWGISWRVRE